MHEELCEFLESRSVYFQPPSSVKMSYPCIKYSLSGVDQRHANDKNYKSINRYEVILLTYDPDCEQVSEIIDRFPMCSFDRWYAADRLNHFVFTLYY